MTSIREVRAVGAPEDGRDRRRHGARWLLLVAAVLVGAGIFVVEELGAHPALVLLFPAGAALLIHAALIGSGIAGRGQADRVLVAGGAAIAGLGLIGGGLHWLQPDGLGRLLMLPAIMAGGMWCLKHAFAPRGHRVFRTSADPVWMVRLGLLMLGVVWPFLGAWILHPLLEG